MFLLKLRGGGGGAHLILQLDIFWRKKPWMLDFGGSTFKAFHYIFKQKFSI